MLLRGAAHIVNYGRGIASETKQYYKERKEYGTTIDDNAPNEVKYSEGEADEADWALDDAIDDETKTVNEQGQAPPPYDAAQEDKLLDRSITEELSTLQKAHSKAFRVSPEAETPLPCPVILPQRSPKHRSRGCVSQIEYRSWLPRAVWRSYRLSWSYMLTCG